MATSAKAWVDYQDIDLVVDVRRDALACTEPQHIDVQLLAVQAPDWPVTRGSQQEGARIDDCGCHKMFHRFLMSLPALQQ